MSHQFDAIYDEGVLKPLVPLSLPDEARVKITVDTQPVAESIDERASQKSSVQEEALAESARRTADFDADLEALLFDGPNLPTDFSRADIYADHD